MGPYGGCTSSYNSTSQSYGAIPLFKYVFEVVILSWEHACVLVLESFC